MEKDTGGWGLRAEESGLRAQGKYLSYLPRYSGGYTSDVEPNQTFRLREILTIDMYLRVSKLIPTYYSSHGTTLTTRMLRIYSTGGGVWI